MPYINSDFDLFIYIRLKGFSVLLDLRPFTPGSLATCEQPMLGGLRIVEQSRSGVVIILGQSFYFFSLHTHTELK